MTLAGLLLPLGSARGRKENIEMVAVVDRDFRFARNRQAEQTGTQANLFSPLDGDHMKLAMPFYSLRFLVPFSTGACKNMMFSMVSNNSSGQGATRTVLGMI
jgi:hypothetical protein